MPPGLTFTERVVTQDTTSVLDESALAWLRRDVLHFGYKAVDGTSTSSSDGKRLLSPKALMLLTSLLCSLYPYPVSPYSSSHSLPILSKLLFPPAVLFTSEQRALLNDALGYFDEAVREASAKEGDTDPIAAARYIH